MAGVDGLTGVATIEKDTNGDVLWTWCFPTCDARLRDVLVAKSGLEENSLPTDFLFGKLDSTWYYIFNASGQFAKLPKVRAFSVVMLSKVYNPEKYASLGKTLSSLYAETGDTGRIMEGYLAVMTRGQFDSKSPTAGKFVDAEHDVRKAYIAGSLKDVVNQFGESSILIFTAVALKKRVAVYSPSVDSLLKLMRAFPLFAWHRQDWGMLRPYAGLSDAELDDLRSASHYCAGFTDAAVGNRDDVYDVFVNAADGTVAVAPQAKEFFVMGKIHKDFAQVLIRGAEDPDVTDQALVKTLAIKTKELLGNLESIGTADASGKVIISPDEFKSKNFPQNVQSFLWNFAKTEGLARY
eukprot:Opistho-2@70772